MNKNVDSKIYNLVEHRKTLWTALIVLSGGTAGLILSIGRFTFDSDFMLKFIFILVGFIFLYVILNGILQINNELNKLLK